MRRTLQHFGFPQYVHRFFGDYKSNKFYREEKGVYSFHGLKTNATFTARDSADAKAQIIAWVIEQGGKKYRKRMICCPHCARSFAPTVKDWVK